MGIEPGQHPGNGALVEGVLGVQLVGQIFLNELEDAPKSLAFSGDGVGAGHTSGTAQDIAESAPDQGRQGAHQPDPSQRDCVPSHPKSNPIQNNAVSPATQHFTKAP